MLLLAALVATLVVAGGAALAVTKVCPAGSTATNPCLGTAKSNTASGADVLFGTGGSDYVKALSGNDWISAGPADDLTNGGSDNDTYAYKDGWGNDTLTDPSGMDAANFSRVTVPEPSGGICHYLYVFLIPDWPASYNRAEAGHFDCNASQQTTVSASVNLNSSVVERVRGAGGYDRLYTGRGSNILKPGGGGAQLTDYGGHPGDSLRPDLPASNDTYAGFRSGSHIVLDWAGTSDTLDLRPYSSDDAFFEALDIDNTGTAESLKISVERPDGILFDVTVAGHLGALDPPPLDSVDGGMERILFADTTVAGKAQAGSLVEAAQPEPRASAGTSSEPGSLEVP